MAAIPMPRTNRRWPARTSAKQRSPPASPALRRLPRLASVPAPAPFGSATRRRNQQQSARPGCRSLARACLRSHRARQQRPHWPVPLVCGEWRSKVRRCDRERLFPNLRSRPSSTRRGLLGGRRNFSFKPCLHFRIGEQVEELLCLFWRQFGGSLLRPRVPWTIQRMTRATNGNKQNRAETDFFMEPLASLPRHRLPVDEPTTVWVKLERALHSAILRYRGDIPQTDGRNCRLHRTLDLSATSKTTFFNRGHCRHRHHRDRAIGIDDRNQENEAILAVSQHASLPLHRLLRRSFPHPNLRYAVPQRASLVL